MKKTFADAFFFLALMSKRDSSHQLAIEYSVKLTCPIFTTYWVLAEVANSFCRPRERGLFAKLLEFIEADDRIQIVPISHRQFQRGAELYVRRPDKAWSLTDCISFLVMEEFKIKDALTGDHHFEQAGFVPLLAEDGTSHA